MHLNERGLRVSKTGLLVACAIAFLVAHCAAQAQSIRLPLPKPGERMTYSYDEKMHPERPNGAAPDSSLHEVFDINVLKVLADRLAPRVLIEWTLRDVNSSGFYKTQTSFYDAFNNVPIRIAVDPRGSPMPDLTRAHLYVLNMDEINTHAAASVPISRALTSLGVGKQTVRELKIHELYSRSLMAMSYVQQHDMLKFGRTTNSISSGNQSPSTQNYSLSSTHNFDVLGVDRVQCIVHIKTSDIADHVMGTTKQRSSDLEVTASVSTMDGWTTVLKQEFTGGGFVKTTVIRRLTPSPC